MAPVQQELSQVNDNEKDSNRDQVSQVNDNERDSNRNLKPSSAKNATSSRLLNLPAEVRVLILEYAISSDMTESASKLSLPSNSLLSVAHVMRTEALPIWHKATQDYSAHLDDLVAAAEERMFSLFFPPVMNLADAETQLEVREARDEFLDVRDRAEDCYDYILAKGGRRKGKTLEDMNGGGG